MQEPTVYLLLGPHPKSLECEDLEISENRMYFKHTQRLLHIIFSWG